MTSPFAYPFWNEGERRLRAGLRLAFLPFVFALLSPIPAIELIQHFMPSPPRWIGSIEEVYEVQGRDASEHNVEAMLGQGSVSIVALLFVIVCVWLAARFLDRRPLDDLGLRIDRTWWIDATFGFALGAGLILAIMGVEVLFGWAYYSPAAEVGDVPRLAYAAVSVFLFLNVAVYEELVFRGYPMKNLSEGIHSTWIGPATAIAISSLLSAGIFGLAHGGNPNATEVAVGNIAIAGIWLAIAYAVTGQLAISMGIHLSWNLVQNLLGMPVSGQGFLGALLVRDVEGDAWITGGAFGPEAGMTGLVAMAAGTILTLVYVRLRRGTLGIDPRLVTPPVLVRSRMVSPSRELNAGVPAENG